MKPKDYNDLPSALEQLSKIKTQLQKKRPVFFLDYDGTLTPIVKRPEDAVLSGEMRETLRKLVSIYQVAIVSGRDRAVVENFVGLKELIYAGSHGFDITGPDHLHKQHEDGKAALPVLDDAEKELRRLLNTIAGAQVERKKFAIAVHYRNAADKDIEPIKEQVNKVQQEHPSLKKGYGKKIIELQPDIDWDKGKAVTWLLNKLGLNTEDVIPFYIGDDLTDENAFRELANNGIGILVGQHGKKTFAKYRLANVFEVRQFFNQVMLENRKKE